MGFTLGVDFCKAVRTELLSQNIDTLDATGQKTCE
jgi:hypothetical protein